MNLSAVLRELMAAGLSGDALIAAVERIESAPSKSTNAARQQRYRDRQKEAQTVTHNVTDVTDVTQSTPPAFPLDGPPKKTSNPPLIPQSPPPKISPASDFDVFWKAYPLKTGKLAAVKAYASAIKRGVDPQTMLDAASTYADNPNRDPQFTKHAATWLNAGCYDDEQQEHCNGRRNPVAGNNRPTRDTEPSNPRVLAFARMAGLIPPDGRTANGDEAGANSSATANPREYPRLAGVTLPSVGNH